MFANSAVKYHVETSHRADVWSALLAGLPANARSQVEKVAGANPPPFVDFVKNAIEHEGLAYIFSSLLESGVIASAISHPDLLSIEEAIPIARAAARLDCHFDYTILANLADGSRNWPHDVPAARIMRVLEIVDATSDCRRLMIPLMKFVKLSDRHLRSKAVKLMARGTGNFAWADSVLSDADPRVRSNLVESISPQLGTRTEGLLRKASNDFHHRVAVTALLALTRLGDESSRQKIERLAREGTDAERRAAAWALAQLAEPPAEAIPSTAAPHQNA